MTTEDSKTKIEVPKSGALEPKPDARRRKLRKIGGLIAGAAALGSVLAGLTGYWTTYRTVTKEILAPAKPAPAEAAHLSIVVLPFTNLSGDPSQDYFADGITDNLTTDLSRIRNSFVIARNTAFTYKGKSIDAKEIGKELGIRYVLEGSVQRDRDRVRVNAQLIDAHSGAHLWADHFDTARPICCRCRTRSSRGSPTPWALSCSRLRHKGAHIPPTPTPWIWPCGATRP